VQNSSVYRGNLVFGEIKEVLIALLESEEFENHVETKICVQLSLFLD
jgi:hypothetical protein